MESLTVIDFFCGAGGFSEGFRQQGFKIIQGIDSWRPAIDTFNHNFSLDCAVKNIYDFESSIEEIEALPNTDVILGSPPCVTFSSSNISGKADKTAGIVLTQIFLRIVAVKKWQKNSTLKAWFMENVPSSIKHLASEYTFDDLGLGEWAQKNKIGKSKVAIQLEGNQSIINSADYGCAQARKRAFSGEIIKKKAFIVPNPTHSQDPGLFDRKWRSLKEIKGALPKPNCEKSNRKVKDPNYSDVEIPLHQLTDHFYDTGLYECVWRQSKFLKSNHPYMGKMSFPEDENRPSRTLTATKIGSSRESIVYRSEYNRTGNGEFRTPTIREASSLMGFPVTYQFLGSEGTKWRLVGNAVSPMISSSLGKKLRFELGLKEISPVFQKKVILDGVKNLNDFQPKSFNNPPRRNEGSRFRRHPFKDGNLTVTLSNYDIESNGDTSEKWLASAQYGTGKGFPVHNFEEDVHLDIEAIIKSQPKGKAFLEIINNGFSEKVAKSKELQTMYESQKAINGYMEPTNLIDELALIIKRLNVENISISQSDSRVFKDKREIPLKQLYALYGISKIVSIANQS